MAQLTALDAGFLKAQDPDRQASLALAAVAIVDGAVPDYDLLKTTTGRTNSGDTAVHAGAADAPVRGRPGVDRLPGIRPHPSRATGRLAAAGRRRRTVPAPSAYALERPLDLDRPLWECWVIEGLRAQPVGDLDEGPPPHGRRHLGGPSSHPALRRRRQRHVRQSRWCQTSFGVTDTRNWADALLRASAGTVARATEAAATAIWPGARISPVRPVKTMRRYSTVRVPIAAVDDVCRKFGVTANDVALAAITEGFRTVLLHRGEEPRADSLRTLDRTGNRARPCCPICPSNTATRFSACAPCIPG